MNVIAIIALATAFLALIACQDRTPSELLPTTSPPAERTIQPPALAAIPISAPSPTRTPDVAVADTPTSTPTRTPGPTAAPTPTPPATQTPIPAKPNDRAAVVIGDVSFDADIADTPALRTKGLSNRPSLPAQTGMLFVFENGKASNFWMKEMQFPLDFVWIGADCTVVDVTENLRHPESPDSPLPIYSSSKPAAFNFEINGGEVTALTLEVGDRVSFNGVDVPGAHC